MKVLSSKFSFISEHRELVFVKFNVPNRFIYFSCTHKVRRLQYYIKCITTKLRECLKSQLSSEDTCWGGPGLRGRRGCCRTWRGCPAGAAGGPGTDPPATSFKCQPFFFFNCCFQVIILSDSHLKTLVIVIVIKSVHVDQLEKLFL